MKITANMYIIIRVAVNLKKAIIKRIKRINKSENNLK